MERSRMVQQSLSAVLLIYQAITGTLVLMELFIHWNGADSLGSAAEIFPPICQVFSKAVAMVVYRQRYLSMLTNLEKFWPPFKFGKEIEDTVASIKWNVANLFNTFRILMVITTTLYLTKPIILKKRMYPAVWYSVCDIENNFCYGCNFLYQSLHVILMYVTVVGFDGIFFALLAHSYCELELIKYGLVNLKIDESVVEEEAESLRQFSSIVDQHSFILRFMDKFNSLYSLVLLNQFATTLASICTGIFLMMMDGFPPNLALTTRYVPYLLALKLQMLLYCVAGEMIAEQSESVAYAMYESKWWCKPQGNLRMGVCLVIARSRNQVKITAGELMDINIATFASVLKTSVSFFTCLQALYESK